jgi:hypothetical protein
LAQRSRKRGHRRKPRARPASPASARPETPARPARAASARPEAPTRRPSAEERNAAVRATLKPLDPGERPWPIKAGALLALLIGGAQLVLFVAGTKLKVGGNQPGAASTIVFAALMFLCAVGTWLKRYWAVLGLMALLALFALYFSIALIKASSALGFAVAIGGLCIAGGLLYKLVRVLSRIQLPRPPAR